MDQQTRDNWLKVKQALEAAGKTDNHYYRRAVEIARGKTDPFDKEDWGRTLG